MRRCIVALVACLAITSAAAAATTEEPLLTRVAANLSRPVVLRAEFTQTKTVAALTRPLVTSGRFVYARQQGILWKIEKPYRATYSLTENGVAEVDATGAVIKHGSGGAGMQHVSRIFRALFEPDFKLLEQYFTPSATGDADRWDLALAPRGPLKQVFKNAHVRGGRYVEEVRFDEANGDTLTIRFVHMKEAVALDGDELRAHRRE